MSGESLVTTALRVLSLRMEEAAPRYGALLRIYWKCVGLKSRDWTLTVPRLKNYFGILQVYLELSSQEEWDGRGM
jgi:hypothetical protein